MPTPLYFVHTIAPQPIQFIIGAEHGEAPDGKGGDGPGHLCPGGALLLLHRAVPAGGSGQAGSVHGVAHQVPSHLGGKLHIKYRSLNKFH